MYLQELGIEDFGGGRISQWVIETKDVKGTSANKFNGIIQALLFKRKPNQSIVAVNILVHRLLRDRKEDLVSATRAMIKDLGFRSVLTQLL